MKKILIAFFAAMLATGLAWATLEDTITQQGTLSYQHKSLTSSHWASMTRNYEIVTAANTIADGECGTTYFLNAASEFASTLPSPAAGCSFRFIVMAAPVGTAYTIVTPGGGNLIDGTTVVNGGVIGCVNEDTITFTASAAISGDWVYLISDGTNWYVTGQAFAATGIACSAT